MVHHEPTWGFLNCITCNKVKLCALFPQIGDSLAWFLGFLNLRIIQDLVLFYIPNYSNMAASQIQIFNHEGGLLLEGKKDRVRFKSSDWGVIDSHLTFVFFFLLPVDCVKANLQWHPSSPGSYLLLNYYPTTINFFVFWLEVLIF